MSKPGLTQMPPCRIIRSKRRSMALEIRADGEVLLRLPLHMSDQQARQFFDSRRQWIEKHLEELSRRKPSPPLSREDILALREEARRVLPGKLRRWADILGVSPAGLRITSAQKRFGSCSGKGGICFSWQLMRYPEDAIDYVVLHEAAHLVHHNHSKAFYQLIALHMPDYKRRQALLKQGPPESAQTA